jgi:hypothetical protein
MGQYERFRIGGSPMNQNEELISSFEEEVKKSVLGKDDKLRLLEKDILKRIPKEKNKKTNLTNLDNYSEMSNEQLIQILGEEVTFTDCEGIITDEYHQIKNEILNRMP